jgi:hypothetical protein
LTIKEHFLKLFVNNRQVTKVSRLCRVRFNGSTVGLTKDMSWAGRIWAKQYIFNNNKTWAEREATQNTQPSPSLNVAASIRSAKYIYGVGMELLIFRE